MLKRGKMDMDDQFAYRYEKVDIQPQPDGRFLVTADVAVTDGGTVEHVQPTILATQDGGTSQPVPVYDGQKRIRLTGVNGEQTQIRLEILPSIQEEAALPITASISTKPYIWSLWLGSILVCLGTLAAVRR